MFSKNNIFLFILFGVSWLLIFKLFSYLPSDLFIEIKTDSVGYSQIFFDTGKGFYEDESYRFKLSEKNSWNTYKITLPGKEISSIRMDILEEPGNFEIKSIRYKNILREFVWHLDKIEKNTVLVRDVKKEKGSNIWKSVSVDPFIIVTTNEFDNKFPIFMLFLVSTLMSMLIVVVLKIFIKVNKKLLAKRSVEKIGYYPFLDGVRALAVVLVILLHCNNTFLPGGGRVGVSIFYVLSGFLITSILIKEWLVSKKLSILSFYKKRIIRLFPALITLLLVFLTFMVFIDFTNIKLYINQTVGTLLYFIPWSYLFINRWWPDYPSYFAHLWTLSIEAKFYTLWAIVLLFILKFFKQPKKIFVVIFGVYLVFLILQTKIINTDLMNIIIPDSHNKFVFILKNEIKNLIDVNLLAGSVLAAGIVYGIFKKDKKINKFKSGLLVLICSLSFLLLIFLSYSGKYNNLTTNYFSYAFFSFLAAIGIWSLMIKEWLLINVFQSPIIRYIGKVSYGLYLYHYPIYVLMVNFFSFRKGFGFFILVFAISLLFASVSYHLVELPFIKYGTSKIPVVGGIK